MEFKMERRFINLLDKEELIAELEHRGLVNLDEMTTDALRKQFRKCFKLEEVGACFSPKAASRSAADEFAVCENKIKLVEEKIGTCNEAELQKFSKKAEAKLSHTLLRLGRIVTTPDQDLATKIVDLTSRGSELLSVAQHAKTATLPGGADEDAESNDGDTSGSAKSSSSSSDEESGSDEEKKARGKKKKARGKKKTTKSNKNKVVRELFASDSEEDGTGQGRTRHSYFRRTPVSQWGLKFSGQDSAMSIRRFFVEVHDFRKANRMSRTDLLREAKFLFEGPALEVFRSCRRQFRDWTELEARITLAFTDPSYERSLKREIEDRKQGSDEPVIVFLSKMDNLFNLLSNPLSEKEKLDIIGGNILPEYQIALSLQYYGSLKQLETLLIKLEKARTQSLASKQPTPSTSVEPSLQHTPNPASRNRTGRSDARISAVESTVSATPASKEEEATLGETLPGEGNKGVYCYTCKTPGVTKYRCPNCAAKKKTGNGETGRQNAGTLPAKTQ